MEFSNEKIEAMIYTIRGQRVMLDSDLSKLYGVETKVLNQAERRNLKRFPEDFIFECDSRELNNLWSQFVTSNPATNWNVKRRAAPMLLLKTESPNSEQLGLAHYLFNF